MSKMRERLANPPGIFVLIAGNRADEVEPETSWCRAASSRNCLPFATHGCKKSGLQLVCFGHAGDGNIHTNIMVDMDQPGAHKRSEAALDELFRWVLAHGGAITGEHGIGLAKKRWWPLAVSKEVRDVHGEIKRTLDPKGILNPGKFI